MKKKKQDELGIRASDPFHEEERKYNAPDAETLRRVQRHVLGSGHYATLNDPAFIPDWLRDLPFRPPQEDSALRYRLYFDDAKLTATRSGIEIRLEYRGDKSSDGWPYKQVIKVGASGSDENSTLDRLEYPAKLRRNMPVLDAVQGAGESFLKAAFNKANLAQVDLYPLVEIVSQRWKLLYHPGSDPETQIELATDLARTRNCAGHGWDLFQIEMEMKKGDAAILPAEEKRLLRRFAALQVETRSKPSPGFDALTPLLERKGARDMLRDHLQNGRFAVLPGLKV